MTRLTHPEPDRWYLPIMEIIEYDIDQIKKGLRLGTDDPTPAFRSIHRITWHLHEIVRLGAIQEERRDNPPTIIKCPND